jgi:hypothetical protein
LGHKYRTTVKVANRRETIWEMKRYFCKTGNDKGTRQYFLSSLVTK